MLCCQPSLKRFQTTCNDLRFVATRIYLYTINHQKQLITGITAYKWRPSNEVEHSLCRNRCTQGNFFNLESAINSIYKLDLLQILR